MYTVKKINNKLVISSEDSACHLAGTDEANLLDKLCEMINVVDAYYRQQQQQNIENTENTERISYAAESKYERHEREPEQDN
jgi:hypothetical protein